MPLFCTAKVAFAKSHLHTKPHYAPLPSQPLLISRPYWPCALRPQLSVLWQAPFHDAVRASSHFTITNGSQSLVARPSSRHCPPITGGTHTFWSIAYSFCRTPSRQCSPSQKQLRRFHSRAEGITASMCSTWQVQHASECALVSIARFHYCSFSGDLCQLETLVGYQVSPTSVTAMTHHTILPIARFTFL